MEVLTFCNFVAYTSFPGISVIDKLYGPALSMSPLREKLPLLGFGASTKADSFNAFPTPVILLVPVSQLILPLAELVLAEPAEDKTFIFNTSEPMPLAYHLY